MSSKIFDKVRKNVSKDSRQFISNSFNVINYIHRLLEKKNMSQKDLAKKLNKSESEISKILSPGHNITLKTLSKLEVALEENIIEIPTQKKISEDKIQLNWVSSTHK